MSKNLVVDGKCKVVWCVWLNSGRLEPVYAVSETDHQYRDAFGRQHRKITEDYEVHGSHADAVLAGIDYLRHEKSRVEDRIRRLDDSIHSLQDEQEPQIDARITELTKTRRLTI